MVKRTFEVVVLAQGRRIGSFSLGYKNLRGFIASMSDEPENSRLFHFASEHASSFVRAAVAGKSCLLPETVEVLSKDTCWEVLKELLHSDAFQESATTEKLKEIAAAYPSAAVLLAGIMTSFPRCDHRELAEFLFQNPEPDVHWALAGNEEIPKSVLERLAGHPDPLIAKTAASTLSV